MKIEEELKLTKPMSEIDKVFLNIMFTGNWANNNSNKYFELFGLTSQQYNVLRILRGSHPESMSSSSIQDRMIDRSSNVTRLMEKLVRKGLATSERSTANKRKVDINITKTGLNLMKEIDKDISSRPMEATNEFSEEDALKLNELLDKIRS